MRGGIIPSWVKDPARFTLLINARGESVNEKAAFRMAMRRRRCLFPADGFYEWRQVGRDKRPYYVRSRVGPIAFAGLYETWNGPNGEEMDTAAIVTTAATRTLAPIHERMPVVAPPDSFDFWLDGAADGETAAALIAPAAEDLFEACEVSPAVNKATNDSPELIAPAPPPTDEPAVSAPARATRKRAKPDDDDQLTLL